jgi:tol-pal system protein YbgF
MKGRDRKSGAMAMFACGMLFLCGMAAPAHAGLFDDEEARKQIAAEKKRVDDLASEIKTQQQTVDTRVGRLEEALKSQALLDLFAQIESLKAEVSRLRGQIEVLNNNVENSAKRQRDLYADLDSRIARIEQHAGGPAAAAPPTPPAVVNAPAPAPANATPSAPVAASQPAAAQVSAPVSGDAGADARNYEAAQAQRRIGNYQGAIVAFQNFIKQYPKSNLAPRAQYWIGESYYAEKRFREAIFEFKKVIDQFPKSEKAPDALLKIAFSFDALGQADLARPFLDEVQQAYPKSNAAKIAKDRIAEGARKK